MLRIESKPSRFLVAGCFILLSCGPAWAGGLYLSEIASPASVGTAGVANVVNNEGPDSSFTNPAGMTGLDVDTFLAGTQVLIPSIKFDSSIATAGGKDGGNAGNTAVIPAAYLVKVLSPDTRFGLSVVAPLGGGVDYGNDFVGRYQATKSALQGISITPALAWQITDRLSLGGGFSLLYSTMDMDLALNQGAFDPSLSDAKLKLDGIDDWSYFATIGLQYQVTDRLLFGAVYRSKSEVELEGDIRFSNLQIPILNRITANINDIEMDFDLPQSVTVGLLFQATDHLRLLVNADWEDWSQFSDFGLSLDSGPTGGAINRSADLKWKDTWHVGAAAVYEPNRNIFTFGVGYDSSPVDDEDRVAFLPADEQLHISAAWGLLNDEIGSFSYSLGTSFIWLGDGKMDQTAQGERFKGEFDQNYLLFAAASLVYKF
jgi:long-chain fatty acid transport protein